MFQIRRKIVSSDPGGARPTRQRQISQPTRDAILKAAEEEFAERGFRGARSQNIADRAGVSKRLAFYHFRSKQGLYQEVLERALTRLGEMMADSVTSSEKPKERLGIFIHQLFSYLASNPNWPPLIIRHLIDDPAQARANAHKYLKPLVDAGRDLIARDTAAGALHNVDPLQMMISILVEVLGYFLLVPFTEGVAAVKPLSLGSLAAREMMVVNLLADGLGMSSDKTDYKPEPRFQFPVETAASASQQKPD
jgi:TetR/AcrR family transcriptional regulator